MLFAKSILTIICSFFIIHHASGQVLPPLISGNSTKICNNEPVTLTATGCDGGSINWNNSMTGESIVLNLPGTYSATCTINGSTSIASQSYVIYSISSGLLTFTGESSCSNTDIKLTPTNLPIGTYPYFYKDSSPINVLNTRTLNPEQGGNYYFTVEDKTSGNWTLQTSSTSQKINDIFFINSSKGWAVGVGGRIGYTTNGGVTWTSNIISSNIEFKAIYFVNEITGWAVGTSGKIFKTTNGGVSWFQQSINGLLNTNTLNGVHFTDINNGWVVVSNGTYYKTTNGGNTWIIEPLNVNSSMVDVFFVNSSTGWVLISRYLIFKTVNGGNTWESLSLPFSIGNVNDVFFSDANNGWAVGSNGYIAQTNDGGNTWNIQVSNTFKNLSKVKFLNNFEGWVVGELGTILHTKDGGITWIKQVINSVNNFNGLYFLDNKFSWIAGDIGEIRKFISTKKGYCPSNNITIKQSPIRPTITKTSCNGSSAVLAASVCTGNIIWNNGNSNTSIIVSSSGTYSLKCFVDGCESIKSKDEIVNLGANVSLQAQNGNICLNQNPILEINGLNANTFGEWRKNQVPFDNPNNTFMPTEVGMYDVHPYTKGVKDWELITPDVPANSLFGATLINKNTAWVAGKYGTLAKTTDGGISWTTKQFDYDFYDIQFLNEQTGYIVAYKPSRNFIFKTIDGGVNWQIIDMNIPYQSIDNIFFLNAQVGWAVGTNKTILKTNDGGLNWIIQSEDNSSTMHLNSVFFINASKGWATGIQGNILFTNDGGNSWSAQNSNTYYSLSDVHFINVNRGYVVGEHGIVLSTLNGGLTWTLNTDIQNITTSTLSNCQFIDEMNGWIFSNGYIFRTIDGGLTWSFQPTDITGGHKIAGFFLDCQNGIVVGNLGKIAVTHDGGVNWSNNFNYKSDLKDVRFINKNIGWTLGYNKIGKTTNGGKNWSFQAINSNKQLTNMFFVDDKIGWLIAQLQIFKTIDGGITWNEQIINVNLNNSFISGIFFKDANNGWLVGTSDLVLKTADGGNSWTEVEVFTTDFIKRTFSEIFFVTQSKGWILGPNGLMYSTQDGGISWNRQNPVTTNNLSNPFVIDANTMWIVADSELLRTTDGGQTWLTTNSGLYYFSKVFFNNKDLGWAIKGSILYHTIDGGNTWDLIKNIKNDNIGLYAFNEDEIITVGINQSIAKYGFLRTYFCPTNSIEINTPSSPMISSMTTILCQGQSLKISASNCTGTVIWNNGFSGEQVVVTTPGSYSSKCVINNCESPISNIIEISLSTNCNQILISPKLAYVCPNSPITLTATGCVSNQIVWTNNFTGSTITISLPTSLNLEAFCQEGGSKSVQINVAQENLNINTNIQDGEYFVQIGTLLQSYSTILTTNSFLGQTKVSFISGKSIILNPGFETKEKTIFQAKIKKCSE